ncbi:membrane protein [Erwinia mallotivora]|uniref:Membrane protein n=1 Tax=Erwinia mallotivora TaxID=69222 RepID=A0A014M043_9GAMM|nr:membrane protein [Erwinia mallotivora]
MTEFYISRAGLFAGLLGSFFIFISFFLYAFNRGKYDHLISLFLKKYEFPPPYSFYHMVGFFGAYQVCRFFINLSKNKRIYFFSRDNPAYSFFSENEITVSRWMLYLSRMWMFTGICYFITGVAVLILYIIR